MTDTIKTIYAHGPGLPTTRQGDCGLILIEEPGQVNDAANVRPSFARVAFVVGLSHVLGVVLFAWR